MILMMPLGRGGLNQKNYDVIYEWVLSELPWSLTLNLWGGGENRNSYISGTKCPIDLKPDWKFKFVRCLEQMLRG